jgi:predicted nucleic acid-binding protein
MSAMTFRCRDPKDDMYPWRAIAEKMPLITGDADLTVLRGLVPIDIMNAADCAVRLQI